jgi:hypothetical protein
MVKKMVVAILAIVLSQATLSAFAAMHFPGTGSVTGTSFSGTATVMGFGSSGFSRVNVRVYTVGNSLQSCFDGGSDDPYVHMDTTTPWQQVANNGQATFSFGPVSIPVASECDIHADGTPLKGKLFALYTGQQLKSASEDATVLAQPTLTLECDIDQTVSPTATCFKIAETH